MDSTVGSRARSRTSLAIGGAILLAGLAGCGDDLGIIPDAAPVDAPAAPVWPAEVTDNSCEDFASWAVGSYVLQSNYWNKSLCPGTQCMEVNTATGAFSVTTGAAPCGDTVASYPNVLYGCSFGNCSPNSMLPMPVGLVSSLKSSWSWSIAKAPNDQFNVAYDIWFCPDNNCGASGFPKGLELMIWLDYQNVHGWKEHLGIVNIAGHNWDVWLADMLVGGASDAWTYLTYMLRDPMPKSVTDLDLNAFFKDAQDRGKVKPNWYLYAIQAGTELRTGGIPFTNNSFSVTLNGTTPSTVPIPPKAPSCDGGAPTATGGLQVSDAYVTAGPLHGYGSAWTWVGANSKAIACAAPTCSGLVNKGEAVSCSPPIGPSAICTAGTVTADPTYNSVAGVGFNLNEDRAVDGGVATLGTVTIPNTLNVAVQRTGNSGGNNSLRVQLTDVNDVAYCYGGALNSPIPVGKLNTKCWNNQGDAATPSTQFKKIDVIVPSSAATDLEFSYCLTDVSIQ